MNKPLIYIDQNVLGLQLDGSIGLKKHPDLCWVYSKEHFSEIRRSANAALYLIELEKIDAKLLELELNSDFRITGAAKLIDQGKPSQHYAAYMDAIGDIDLDDNLFDPLQAWCNGGCDEDALKQLPSQLVERVLSLIQDLPVNDNKLFENIGLIEPVLNDVIYKMIEHGNDINNTREFFGVGKGAIGGLSGENQVKRIWDLISPACHGISCDQFFGFDPINKQGYETWPVYLGIISCCAAMDIIGFCAEKKCRKLDKLPNVRSDMGHIGMGAYCSAIISEDRRLIKRAASIYEYKGIRTSPLLLRNSKL